MTQKHASATQTQPLTTTEQQQLESVARRWDDALQTMTPAEQEEVLRTTTLIRPDAITDGVYQPCPNEKKPLKKNCVDPSMKLGMGEEAKQKILADAGTAISLNTSANRQLGDKSLRADIGKLLEWEQNYAGAYVPWAPEFRSETVDVGNRNIKVLIPSTERDHGNLSGWKVGKYLNSSGVTVGMGVDLGRKTEQQINKLVDDGVNGMRLLNENQARALKTRLRQYIGKTRTEACQFLRMNPLTLTQDEVDTLNYSSVKDHLVETFKSYEKMTGSSFADLAGQEQTLLLSKHYHTGNIARPLALSLSKGDQSALFGQLTGIDREYRYMKAYYDSLPEEK